MTRVRYFMRWGTVLGTAGVLSGCAVLAAFGLGKPDAAAPPERPKNPKVTLVAAGGDSLRYRLSWGAARSATGYEVVVRPVAFATTGWTGLPANTVVTTTDLAFTAINTAYDSVRFRAVVWSRRGAERSRDSVYVEWSVRRALGAPGPITVDSSLVITGLRLLPGDTALVAGVPTTFCAFWTFGDGSAAWRASGSPAVQCETLARTVGGIPTSMQQLLADRECVVFRVETISGPDLALNQSLCAGEAVLIGQ